MAPKTWAAGEKLLASDVNSNFADLSCRLTLSSPFSPTADTWTLITGWDTETFDTNTFHDNSTNPERITILTAGLYLFGANLASTASVANIYHGVKILLDGTTQIAGQRSGGYLSTTDRFSSCSGIYRFSANQYITAYALDRNGSAIDVAGTNFWICLISK